MAGAFISFSNIQVYMMIALAVEGKGMSGKEEKEEWVEKHACCIQQKFEQWQKPLGINSEDYLKYLRKELFGFCENPLKKSLIEMIS